MDVIEAIKERRSINFFDSSKRIPEERLKELLSIASMAPSSFNLQPWKVIYVNDPEKRKILRECAFNQPKVEEASAVFIIIADPDAVEENIDNVLNSWQELGYIKQEVSDTYKEMAKNLYGEKDSIKRKLFAVKNASLFAMNLMIAARGMGLETHPMDGFDEEMIKKRFKIPDNKIIPMLIAVGYLKPGITLLPRAWRKDVEEFMSIDEFKER